MIINQTIFIFNLKNYEKMFNIKKTFHLFTSSEEDSSMAIETSATQQSRRPRHNPENNNPIY
jgi:hypothetical protein